MKPLETSQRVLTWLCMCPASANTDKLTKLAYISLTIFTFIGMTGIITSSVAFFVTFFSTRLEEALVSMFQVSGTGGSWYMFIAVFPSRHKIKTIFDRLKEICQNSTMLTTTTLSYEIIQMKFLYLDAGEESQKFLMKANDKSEWIWRSYFKLMIYALISIPIVSAGSVLISYMLRGTYDNNYLYHPFKIS